MMTNENVDEIKRYIGIVAEDFKDKLNFVIDGQLELKKEVSEFKVRMTNVETDVKDIKLRLTNVETDVKDIKLRLTNVETDVKDIKARMTNVETEIGSHRDNTEMHAMRIKRKRKTSA